MMFEPPSFCMGISTSNYFSHDCVCNFILRDGNERGRFYGFPLQLLSKFRIGCFCAFVVPPCIFCYFPYGDVINEKMYLIAEFVQVFSPSHLKMRVWERGAG